jgi:hypothetical protein
VPFKFELHSISVTPAAGPARPPFNIFHAISEEASRDGLPLFSPEYTFRMLLGTWETASKFLNPRIWAPHWNDAQLDSFAANPYLAQGLIAEPRQGHALRVKRFLQHTADFDPNSDQPAPWTIVHFTGRLGSKPDLISKHSLGVKRHEAGSLRDKLVACGTRLFILQCLDLDLRNAENFAEWITGGGGPAGLVVACDDQQTLDEYFANFYANVSHNQPLSHAVNPTFFIPAFTSMRDIEVKLYLGTGGDSCLQLDAWVRTLRERIDGDLKKISSLLGILDQSANKLSGYVHPQHAAAVLRLHDKTVRHYRHLTRILTDARNRVMNVPSPPWDHEREGSIPVSEATAQTDSLKMGTEVVEGVPCPKVMREKTPQPSTFSKDNYMFFHAPPPQPVPGWKNYSAWVKLLDAAAENAPRVLNAGFGENSGILDPNATLVAGREYFLLIDVGPRWNKVKSLVSGLAKFPEYALDPGEEGHEIDVLFVSTDFSPRISTGRIWLPRSAGRSHPITDDGRSSSPGPLALQVRVPDQDSKSGEVKTATGRISLYYRGNVIQSAALRAAVAAIPGIRSKHENVIEVDYVLASGFQELESRCAKRALKVSPDQQEPYTEVALNFTLNDDGNGGHRIVVMPRKGSVPAEPNPPPGMVPYNPQAAREVLDDARAELLNCFFLRNQQGEMLKSNALNSQNGKTKEQFLFDLRTLSKLGAKLFKIVTQQVNVENDQMKPREWARSLRQVLTQPSLIQVARTVRCEYAFPWSLVYDIPMPGPAFKFCQVVDEWDDDGRRKKTSGESGEAVCPYADRNDHQESIYCPYGFWGLKHTLEQPPSVLKKDKDANWVLTEATPEISYVDKISLSVGITRDPELNAYLIQDHLKTLAAIAPFQVSPPSPADDVNTVRNCLQAPVVVYFLCHGKYDNGRKSCYLGVGNPDDEYHKVYPEMIQDWVDSSKQPNLAAWSSLHPLVFVNGCQTCMLKPEETLQFVSAFTYAAAGGMLGTEISIKLPLATEVAEFVLAGIAKERPIGEVLREMRWLLANKGCLLGLAYTLYAMADLHLSHKGSSN